MADTYCCDGKNPNCEGIILYDKVNWFSSKLGFCDCCMTQLRKAPRIVLDLLYDNSDNDEVAEYICNLTK